MNKCNRYFLFVTLSASIVHIISATDYCKSPNLCPSNNHIACGHNGKFAKNCPADATMVDMNAKYKSILLEKHNEKRNFIAGGGDAKHEPACRMATMQWDDELAALAALNVKQCKMSHDKCRNTATFKYAGQNLAWMGNRPPVDITARLSQVVSIWYDEVHNSDMSNIRSYPQQKKVPAIGHFTVMMADKNIRVGCAASYYSQKGMIAFLVACNYATTNLINWPIYIACSTAGSGCKTGKNPLYPHLCSVSEEYNVNDLTTH